ncbi:hypothetical protein GCM10028857_00290 [Salinarchaeum chitinilyticum]
MSLDLDGLDSLEERIEAVKESLADGTLDPDSVFSGEFMATNTDHGSLTDFYRESPRTLADDEPNLRDVDDAGFDAYVSDNSVFKDWDSMVNKAAEDHVEGHFGN